MKNSFARKQIPTLLGVGILIISLIGGVLLIGQGGGVFAPRATPQTEPKNIHITNLRDNSFSVSFMTDEATVGFVKYGTDPSKLNLQASDDRDQLSGSVSPYTTHHITLRDLQAANTYYFTLGTGTNAEYLNNGAPFKVTTGPKLGNSPAARTIYGTVNSAQGTPASGAIVYVQSAGMEELSGLVKDSGSWAIPLSTARVTGATAYMAVTPDTLLDIFIQGLEVATTSQLQAKFSEAQPVQPIALGAGGGSLATTQNFQVSENPLISPVPTDTTSLVATETALLQTATATPIVVLEPSPSPLPEVVNVNAQGTETVGTTQPIITGQAPANVTVTIEVHSNTQLMSQIVTDSSGTYTLDLSQLGKDLEPGEHSITISYTDPKTGQKVTEQKTFFVQSTGLLAAASPSPSPIPFGTSNPFPVETASPSPTASSSARPNVIATDSSDLPQSGSTSFTFLVLGGGILLFLTGLWSWSRVNTAKEELD